MKISDGEATEFVSGPDAVTVIRPADPSGPKAHPVTEVAAHQLETLVLPQHPPTEVAVASPAAQTARDAESTVTAAPRPGRQVARPAPHPPTADAVSPGPALVPVDGLVRYGPGVPVEMPVSQGGRTAERVWSGSQQAKPTGSGRLRRTAGWALTVVLLVASGVILFLRFYHPPFQVTGATISQQKLTGCRVEVTGRIATNGSAGTVTYRWIFQPGQQQATTLRQTVSGGQHAVDVSVAIEGNGQGRASQTAILQVLGPVQWTESTRVALSC